MLAPAPAPSDPIALHPFLPLIEDIAIILADNCDHPEVWRAIAEAATFDVTDLCALLDLLRVGSTGGGLKTVNLLSAMLNALVVDRDSGLAALHSMLADYPHCPQVAGAIFFISRHGQPGPSPDLTGRFCDWPFIKFETLMDGTVAPCCSIWTQQRLGQLDGQTAAQIWNSPPAQAMRASIHNGSFAYCNKLRCSKIIDDELPAASAITDPVMRAVIDDKKVELDHGPSWVFLAHDVTCNLSCPSCRDQILAADEAQEQRFEVIERDVLQPLLGGQGRVRLSLSGQGDPWSSPHYRSILRYLADHQLDVQLELHTNALLMDAKRWSDYAGLERYNALVDVSIDACTPWVYETVRRPGKWNKLLPNLQLISKKRTQSVFREFHINTTIQLDNYHEMPALVSFAQAIGADSVRMYMMQNTGGHIAGDYTRKNIAHEAHPLHMAFLETLRDRRLGMPTAHLYDVAHWRARAMAVTLPSDALPANYSLEQLMAALREADGRPDLQVALCAAGRIRFPADLDLPLHEARALAAIGFRQQAEYRLKERIALGGETVTLERCVG